MSKFNDRINFTLLYSNSLALTLLHSATKQSMSE